MVNIVMMIDGVINNRLIQVNLPKRHLRVTATSDIRQLSELPIEIFNTKLPPSSGNLREAAQNHSPDGYMHNNTRTQNAV